MRKLFALILCLFLVAVSPALATVSTFAKDGPYTGNGVTAQEFTITFEFFATSAIVATSRVTATGVEATLDETTDYTITTTGGGPYTGGTLTLVASLAATSTLTISRAQPQTQTTDLVSGDTLPSEAIEDRFDKLTLQIQDLQEQISRCLRVPLTDGSTVEAATELDDAISRASSYLTFTAAGLPTTSATAITGTTATAFGASLIDDANASAAQTTLGISTFVKTTLDDASAAAFRTTIEVPDAITILDQDDMADNSATKAASQQSIKAFVTSGTITMTNKTLTAPVLTSAVLNTAVSGTAVLDEDAMGSNSATKLATQQSIKAYVDSLVSSVGQSSQAGVTSGATITNTSASYADMSGMTISMTTTGGNVLLMFSTTFNGTWDDFTECRFDVDGSPLHAVSWVGAGAASRHEDFAMQWLVTSLSAASHTFKVQWKDAQGTATQVTGSYPRVFTAVELPN